MISFLISLSFPAPAGGKSKSMVGRTSLIQITNRQALHAITQQTTRAEWGATCKGVGEGGGGVRTGTGAVKRGGGTGTEGCVFVGCLREESRMMSGKSQIIFGSDQIYRHFFIKMPT